MPTSKKKTAAATASPSKRFQPSAADLKDAPQRAKKILALLRGTYPQARCALTHSSALELLIATILSAQCTDERVNRVTGELFREYPTAADYAQAKPAQLEKDIRSIGCFRNKTKSIRAACRDIAEKFGGEVPGNLADLTSLAGVGRKTANVLLGNIFHIPAVVTDTHVIRLSRLMGLSRQHDPAKIELDLMGLFPRKDWTLVGHLLIFHGRSICLARKPGCDDCPVRRFCCYGRKKVP